MVRIFPALFAIMFLAAAPATRPSARIDPGLPTLFIAGDSTVKNGTKGQQGWGDPIANHFDSKKINVVNRARGGRSSRTFQTEGLWDQLLADAKKGDFVLIQFGHNDGGPLDDAARARGTIRGTGDQSSEIDNPITKKPETVHTYGWYLRKYIADARDRGVTPIICAPVPRVPKEKVTGLVKPASYALWAKEVAAAENVPFIDLENLILTRYANLTPEQIKQNYFCETDKTHTNATGAALSAEAVVEGIRELKDVALASYLTAR